MADEPTYSPPTADISDDDILDAMRRIPGYLDITTTDFRDLYRLAREYAQTRAFAHIRAAALMHQGVVSVRPDTMMDEAARTLAQQGRKSVPVVDADGRVVGVLSESDFLRRLGAGSFLRLLLTLMEDPASFGHRCHVSPVSGAMSSPAATVNENAGFAEIAAAFQCCGGRSLPVVDAEGGLLGLLLRKDFVAACAPEAPS